MTSADIQKIVMQRRHEMLRRNERPTAMFVSYKHFRMLVSDHFVSRVSIAPEKGVLMLAGIPCYVVSSLPDADSPLVA